MKNYDVVGSKYNKKLVVVHSPLSKKVKFLKVYDTSINSKEEVLCSVGLIVGDEFIAETSSDIILFIEELKLFENGDAYNRFLKPTERTLDERKVKSLQMDLYEHKLYFSRSESKGIVTMISSCLNAYHLPRLQDEEQRLCLNVWMELFNDFQSKNEKWQAPEFSFGHYPEKSRIEMFCEEKELLIKDKEKGSVLINLTQDKVRYSSVMKLSDIVRYIDTYKNTEYEKNYSAALQVKFILNSCNFEFSVEEIVDNLGYNYDKEKVKEELNSFLQYSEKFEELYKEVSSKIKKSYFVEEI